MTSIDEAYLPLNMDFLKNEKFQYLKDIYNNSDNSIDQSKITHDDFDPNILISQCNIYREKMESYLETFKKTQDEIIETTKKIETLESCLLQITQQCTDEHINPSVLNIRSVIETLKSKQSSFIDSHSQTAALIKNMFNVSAHFTENDPRHLCPICINNEVDIAIVPSGHTVCSLCSIKCNLQTCIVCRNNVEKIMKLYYC